LSRRQTTMRVATTALLHLVQPLARLIGRLHHGLTPWRRRGTARLALPMSHETSFWEESWKSSEQRLEQLMQKLRAKGAVVRHGGNHDRWDLDIRGGLLGSRRLLVTIEEHGAGRQLIRLHAWPRPTVMAAMMVGAPSVLAIAALLHGATLALAVLGTAALAAAAWALMDCAFAAGALRDAVRDADGKRLEVKTSAMRASFKDAIVQQPDKVGSTRLAAD